MERGRGRAGNGGGEGESREWREGERWRGERGGGELGEQGIEGEGERGRIFIENVQSSQSGDLILGPHAWNCAILQLYHLYTTPALHTKYPT